MSGSLLQFHIPLMQKAASLAYSEDLPLSVSMDFLSFT